MHAALSLSELQQQFMAALYDADVPGPATSIAGNGLAPEARLHIYRNSCNEIQTSALRTTYPAVLALVGEAFFDQSARGYRRAHPSHSGNLQAFGETFAEYLETLTGCRSFPYLPDVARLEWLRQQTVLAPDSQPIDLVESLDTSGGSQRIVLHPSLHLLESRYPVFTIWHYALQPTSTRLVLDGGGESVVLWREDGEVAMATLDPASFACIAAFAHDYSLDDAQAAAMAVDPDFALVECVESLLQRRLITGIKPFVAPRKEPPTCR
ncbi:MAG: putative DNA-binding domain-containing protein [Xanthomonadaceae bacterium]|nr:putative DNA-binding domain-containing protein [Xanthomonadaceae bacterium]